MTDTEHKGMTDKEAEVFVKGYVRYLLPGDIYINLTKPRRTDGTEEHIEGADWQSFSLIKRNGNIEVKCIANFLTHGSDAEEPTGAIQFELFQSMDKINYNKWYGGWLVSICDAFWYTVMRQEIRKGQLSKGYHVDEVKARTPGALVMVLTDHEGKPFACVAFEDIPKLVIRLLKLCPDPVRWGLTNPYKQTPATDRKYWNEYDSWKQFDKWNDKYGKVVGNMWHVPGREVIDLATVTMIGKDPDILQTFTNKYHQTITAELQRQRLNTLKEKAKERGEMMRLIPEDARAEGIQKLAEVSKKTGIPANKLYPVKTEELTEKLYDPDILEEMKATYNDAIQRHNALTGEDLPMWEEHNRQMIEQARQRITDQRKE